VRATLTRAVTQIEDAKVKAAASGPPVYAVVVKSASPADVRAVAAALSPETTITFVPPTCETVEPIHPDMASDSWGAAEDRAAGTAGP